MRTFFDSAKFSVISLQILSIPSFFPPELLLDRSWSCLICFLFPLTAFKNILFYFFVFLYCTLGQFLSIMFQFTDDIFNQGQLRRETCILFIFISQSNMVFKNHSLNKKHLMIKYSHFMCDYIISYLYVYNFINYPNIFSHNK